MSSLKYKHPSDIIVEYINRIYTHGMTTTSGGNLSILDSDGNIWISPSGIDKGSLRRDDIMCITPDGEIIGKHKPSCEWPFHKAIFEMRPDIKAILHAHPPALVSFSIAGKTPALETNPIFKSVCQSVGFAGYDVPGSEGLGKKIALEFKKGHNTILLRNHGTCCAGKTMDEAFKRFESLDFCARTISNALALGKPKKLTAKQLEQYDAFTKVDKFKKLTGHVTSSNELELRTKLAYLTRRAYEQYLFTSTTGSFAARLDNGAILVAPAEFDRENISADDFIVVKGDMSENGKAPDPMISFYKQVFESQPDVNVISLSRPQYIMGYATSHAPFDPCVIPESYIVLREMPTFAFGAYDKVLKTLSPRYPVVLINNDCMITVGKTPIETFDKMEVAEYSAKATIAANAFGGMTPINQKQVNDLIKAFKLIP